MMGHLSLTNETELELEISINGDSYFSLSPDLSLTVIIPAPHWLESLTVHLPSAIPGRAIPLTTTYIVKQWIISAAFSIQLKISPDLWLVIRPRSGGDSLLVHNQSPYRLQINDQHIVEPYSYSMTIPLTNKISIQCYDPPIRKTFHVAPGEILPNDWVMFYPVENFFLRINTHQRSPVHPLG